MKLSIDLQHPTYSTNYQPIVNDDGTVRCVGVIHRNLSKLLWTIEVFRLTADFATHDECVAYMQAVQDMMNKIQQ